MDFTISTATSDDLEIILELQKECYKTEAILHNEFTIPPLTQTSASIKEDFNQGMLFLKGVVNDQLIASVRGNIDGSTAYIGRLMVKKEFQNQKLGQLLMKEIETKLSQCKRYELFTGFKSEKNIALYKKLGYTEFKREYINTNVTLVYLEKMR